MQSSTSKLIDEIGERALRIGANRFSVARTTQRLHRQIAQHGGRFTSPIDTTAVAAKKVQQSSLGLPVASLSGSIR